MQDLTRFNKIAIQGTPQMAVDKEAISLSRVYLNTISIRRLLINNTEIVDK